MRGRRTTKPTPATGPAVRYEGIQTRRVLWVLVTVEIAEIIIHAL